MHTAYIETMQSVRRDHKNINHGRNVIKKKKHTIRNNYSFTFYTLRETHITDDSLSVDSLEGYVFFTDFCFYFFFLRQSIEFDLERTGWTSSTTC